MTRGLLLRERYRSVLNKVVSQDVAEELMKGDVELGGENRLVTVLFADIRGFTTMTEGMEPQEVIGLLNECMEHLSEAIDAEGGVVDKFIGDEVMAVFGAPATQDDHARRAVSAALRMREDMAAFNAVRRVRGDVPDRDRRGHQQRRRRRRQHGLVEPPQLHGRGRHGEPRLAPGRTGRGRARS